MSFGCCTWPRAPEPVSCDSCIKFEPADNWLSNSSANCLAPSNPEQYLWCDAPLPSPPSPPPSPPAPPPGFKCCTWPRDVGDCGDCEDYALPSNWLSVSKANCERSRTSAPRW